MFENDNKGLYDNYSMAGRDSAEKYGITRKKLLEKNKKRNSKYNYSIFNDSSNNNINNKTEDDLQEKIDIFEIKSPLNKSKSEKSNLILSKMLNNEKYRYHNYNIKRTMELKKKELKNKYLEEGPSLSKYSPKMDYIWSRSLSGPKWKTLSSRKFKYVENNWEISDMPKIYNDDNKCLVNMQKQTMRFGIPLYNDVRIRCEKKFIPPLKNRNSNFNIKKKILMKQNKSTINIFKKNTNNLSQIPNSNNSNSLNKSSLNINNYSYSSLKKNKVKLIPDFKKSMSRLKSNKTLKKEIIESPSLKPNYSYIQERPIMMVLYDKNIYKKKKKDFKGMDTSILYDINKVYNKYNNHKEVSVPLFKDMISRENDNNDSIPSYMKGVFNKIATFCITNKSLEMNHFSQGRFLDYFNNPLFQKKSFNKLINLSLLNNNNKSNENCQKDKEYKIPKFNKHFLKTINFYKMNFDNLDNESDLRKFDNVTYKTIKKNCYLSKDDFKYKNFYDMTECVYD